MEAHAYLAMTYSLLAYAMLPTAVGLIVAAPAVAIYNLRQGSVEKLNTELVAFSLNTVSLLVGETELPRTNNAWNEPSGYTARLIPRFPLQRPLSQLLAPAFAIALGLVIVAWTALGNPYLAKGFVVRLLNPAGAPGRPSNSNSLTIEVMEHKEAGSRVVYLNARKARLEEVFDTLQTVSQQQREPSAYIRAEDNVPWADVANAIDAATGVGYQVILCPRSLQTRSRNAHKSAKIRK